MTIVPSALPSSAEGKRMVELARGDTMRGMPCSVDRLAERTHLHRLLLVAFLTACSGPASGPTATSGGTSSASGGATVGGSSGGGGTTGGCPSGQNGAPQTACGGICTDTASDPRNCGACGLVCPDGCSQGHCQCNVLSSGGCASGEVCADGLCLATCGPPGAGCGDGGLCQPFGSTDPPIQNVGVCVAAGSPENVCNPFSPGGCPAQFGCAPEFDSQSRFLGYGQCWPDGGPGTPGARCLDIGGCQPGLVCGTGTCQQPCDPWAPPTCDGGTFCVPLVNSNGQYADIGGCSSSGGSGTLGTPCSYSTDCSENLICTAGWFPDGGSACTHLCDPRLDGGCPAGLACDWLFTEASSYFDYAQYGACLPEADGGGLFSACGGDAGACAGNLLCIQFPEGSICEQFCDPFASNPCPDGHVCWPQTDRQGNWGGYGMCGQHTGSGHAGQACTGNGACASGDCYYPSFTAIEGTCIQACALDGVLGCGDGICVDGGFGNGLGYCTLLDGGTWD